jgi:hypothetical protein
VEIHSIVAAGDRAERGKGDLAVGDLGGVNPSGVLRKDPRRAEDEPVEVKNIGCQNIIPHVVHDNSFL